MTWEVCPRCDRVAAVGWASVAPSGDGPAECLPVEFDCTAGCQVGLEVLAESRRLGRRSPCGPADEPG